MTKPWDSGEPPPEVHATPLGWALLILRGGALILTMIAALLVNLVLRGIEYPFAGQRRPLSGQVPRVTSRMALRLMGIGITVRGRPMKGAGAIVSNHCSWLDIFTLNAGVPVFFVAKSEVAGWAGINVIARAAGTIFIERKSSEARRQQALFETRFAAGDRLLFFPEGTSSDGTRVLPFKTSLFAAFFADGLRENVQVQPVTVVYHAPPGRDPRYYGWWGDMSFGTDLIKSLATVPQGRAELIYHEPLIPAQFPDRKALAQTCEVQVRKGLQDALGRLPV
ncbi:lysophospholipid acyltransferase family protein [Chachezhania antarctica]|uniref:lysophospholipid acyltransferase family protein n=1 Tax=Chachezhania antarctica TaxID=2340860 RepID=UPI000EB3480F|nr:lysophospholipid acyltransferase family protein [Chachezhania antarctica]|tara:strand:+ start:543 stop:1382 length:840 start_codon:yes stop_codon:yes gene_type:complete